MHISLQPAFVLHRRPFKETSLLLDVFASDYGRIALIAKGAQRPGSSLRGLLQPFYPLMLSWSGRHDLMTLIGAEAAAAAPPLTGRRLLSGLYLNELLVRLLYRNDPHPELFRVYRATLDGLGGEGAEEPILRLFEKRLLDALGYGLSLELDAASGAPIESGGRYRYHADRGPVAEGTDDGQGIPIGGETLLALARESLDGAAVLRESKLLMRWILGRVLGDRPLASRELFR